MQIKIYFPFFVRISLICSNMLWKVFFAADRFENLSIERITTTLKEKNAEWRFEIFESFLPIQFDF